MKKKKVSISFHCQELQPVPADDTSKYSALTGIVGINEILFNSQVLIRFLTFHLFPKFIHLTRLSIELLTGSLRF